MGEDVDRGFDGWFPSGNPVPVSFDRFGGRSRSNSDLELAKSFSFLFVLGDSKEAREDVVEVDGSTGEEIRPLRLWELWTGKRVDD